MTFVLVYTGIIVYSEINNDKNIDGIVVRVTRENFCDHGSITFSSAVICSVFCVKPVTVDECCTFTL